MTYFNHLSLRCRSYDYDNEISKQKRTESLEKKGFYTLKLVLERLDHSLPGLVYNKTRYRIQFFLFLVISGLWLSSFCVMSNSSSKITIICISIILSTSILLYMTTYIPVFAESPPDLCEYNLYLFIFF